MSSSNNLFKDDDEVDEKTRTRSCCGCVFFLLVLWIWIALGAGLAYDELAIRDMKDASGQFNRIECGWQSRTFKPASTQPLSENYRERSHLTTSHEKGRAYFALVICVAPFATALIVSACMKNGQEEFEAGDSFKPGDSHEKARIDQLTTKWRRTNIAVKVIGFLGTFVFEVAAYMVFSTALYNCSAAPFPNSTLSTNGDPRIGRTLYLLLSAVVVTGILVVVMVALIVILTSENANELAFVVGLSTAMSNIGCEPGCPECNAIDCDSCAGESSAGSGGSGDSDRDAGCSEICCCCGCSS